MSVLQVSELHACDPVLHKREAWCTSVFLKVPSGAYPNSQFDNLFRFLSHFFFQGNFFHASNVIGMMVVNLLIHLLTGYLNLLCIDYDYVIACINMGCELRFVLSS